MTKWAANPTATWRWIWLFRDITADFSVHFSSPKYLAISHSSLRVFCCPTGSPIPRLPGTTEVGMSPVRSMQPRDQLAQTFVVTATVSTSLLACATALVYRIKRDNVVWHGWAKPLVAASVGCARLQHIMDCCRHSTSGTQLKLSLWTSAFKVCHQLYNSASSPRSEHLEEVLVMISITLVSTKPRGSLENHRWPVQQAGTSHPLTNGWHPAVFGVWYVLFSPLHLYILEQCLHKRTCHGYSPTVPHGLLGGLPQTVLTRRFFWRYPPAAVALAKVSLHPPSQGDHLDYPSSPSPS